MRRVLLSALIVIAAATGVGLLLGGDGADEDLRRVGLPTLDDTVATLLDDGTPVFVTRDADDDVQVVDARTPARAAGDDGVDLPDLLDGLVGWCAAHGFVDDLEPPATFTLAGAATGATDAGLGVYAVAERHRAHVMVADAEPAGRTDGDAEAAVADCADADEADDADHHGEAMREVAVDEIPAGSSWVVDAAVDLDAGVVCEPPPDPLAWPLCPDGGVDADLPDRDPDVRLPDGDPGADDGDADGDADRYADRRAYGFVGRFLVARPDEDAPLAQVWRLPFEVQLRAEPLERTAEAMLALADDPEAAETVTGEAPLATVRVTGGGDGDGVADTLPIERGTAVVVDGATATGEDGVAALEAALADDPERRWRLEVRRDPLRPPRLQRIEAVAG